MRSERDQENNHVPEWRMLTLPAEAKPFLQARKNYLHGCLNTFEDYPCSKRRNLEFRLKEVEWLMTRIELKKAIV